MKQLYIIRHAKSSWNDESLADFDRPLNERGKKDAPRMGRRLKERNIVPDLLLSSPAKRALSTSKRIAEEIGYNKDKIKTDSALYHADEDEILSVIKGVSDKHNIVFVFGHNPGLTDFANAINQDKKSFITNIPTCGIVCITFQAPSWNDIEAGTGELVFFDFPKSKED